MFGHCVKIFYRRGVREARRAVDASSASTSTTAWSILHRSTLPQSKQDEIKPIMHACHEHRPELAMVDSGKGIAN